MVRGFADRTGLATARFTIEPQNRTPKQHEIDRARPCGGGGLTGGTEGRPSSRRGKLVRRALASVCG